MKKRILIVSDSNLFREGIASFLLSWVKSADREQYDFTWYVPGRITDEGFSEKFRRENVKIVEGGRIFPDHKLSFWGRLASKASFFKMIFKIYSFMKKESFDIVHINSGTSHFHLMVLFAARACKIPQRIAHSHNAGVAINGFQAKVGKIGQCIIKNNATRLAACSMQAAAHIFGKAEMKETLIVHNCIDAEKFKFSAENRIKIRDMYGLDNCFVLGHVGRFAEQKNHNFLIDIFRYVEKKEPNARLVLIGTGSLENKMRGKVDSYGLTDKVIFTGVIDAVQAYLCAMDVFVLPSLYEGLPVVGVEAQANGLPCVFSDAITAEVDILGSAQFVPLQTSAEQWADMILSCKEKSKGNRGDAWKTVAQAGYDISCMKKYIKTLYE